MNRIYDTGSPRILHDYATPDRRRDISSTLLARKDRLALRVSRAIVLSFLAAVLLDWIVRMQ